MLTLKRSCTTCHLQSYSCPGHPGHIDLPVPVYNPIFISHVYNLLKSVCLNCYHIKGNAARINGARCRLRLLRYGLLDEAGQVAGFSGGSDPDPNDAEAGGRTQKKKEHAEDEDKANIRRQNEITERAFEKRGGEARMRALPRAATLEAVADSRRQTIKDLLAHSRVMKTCGHCA